MVKELRTAILVAVTAALLAACAPAQQQSPEQVQLMVATSVAATVQAQNDAAASAAQALTAQAPQPTATASLTPIPLVLPTADTSLVTATAFVVVPASSGGSGGSDPATAKYACSWREVRPRFNVFSPGDAIDVEWVITNTGTKAWYQGLDLNFVSGTRMSPFGGQELPALKPGDSTTVEFEANAPMKNGLYGMQFKVQGGLCFPTLNIQVGPKKDP